MKWNSSQNIPKYCSRLFWLFTISHVVLWTIAFSMVRHSFGHDGIETVIWARHLEWGYDKHPWLTALVAHFVVWKIGYKWLIYFLTELYVAVGFWAIWQLGRKIFSPIYALVGVMLLEAVYYYTYSPPMFNVHIPLFALWPLLTLIFYNALQRDKWFDWLGVGIVAGLAMMTKYNTAILLLFMLGFMLLYRDTRRKFLQPGFYLALSIFLIIILPNIYWLIQHDFISIQYLMDKSSVALTWHQRIYNCLNFIINQFLIFLPAVGLYLLLFDRTNKPEMIIERPKKISVWQRNYLLIVGLGLFVFTAAVPLLFGARIYNLWGTPMLFLWGFLLLVCWPQKITASSWHRFLIGVFVVMFGFIGGYLIISNSVHGLRINDYPAPEIAKAVEAKWHNLYNTPLKYVAGDRYIASYVGYYAPEKPEVFIDWNQQESEWIDQNDLQKSGAIFIRENQASFPPDILRRYPKLQVLPLQSFNYYRDAKKVKPVIILIGILPPTP
jgi:4-amino-4-deoxy-L-arabinose transferase-like glycosyltransferase